MPDPMAGNRFRKRLAASVVGKYGEFLRALGANAELHQWLKAQQPFPYFPQRFELYEDIDAKILRNEPIDYLEFGVFHGDSILKWASINSHPASRFIGFDSFEGLPAAPDGVTGYGPEGAFSTAGAVPATSDSRVRFISGWFNETLRPFLLDFEPRSRLVIHNDSDLYSSTLYMLSTIDPILKAGSILIFDEFANPLHEWKAFRDYSYAFDRTYRMLGAAGYYYTQVALEMTR
jgi:O-methyltransferase